MHRVRTGIIRPLVRGPKAVLNAAKKFKGLGNFVYLKSSDLVGESCGKCGDVCADLLRYTADPQVAPGSKSCTEIDVFMQADRAVVIEIEKKVLLALRGADAGLLEAHDGSEPGATASTHLGRISPAGGSAGIRAGGLRVLTGGSPWRALGGRTGLRRYGNRCRGISRSDRSGRILLCVIAVASDASKPTLNQSAG
jgi:hypothetical protein